MCLLFDQLSKIYKVHVWAFGLQKRLNAQIIFYSHVDLPLSYTSNLLDPIEPLSLNFSTPIFICKNTVE